MPNDAPAAGVKPSIPAEAQLPEFTARALVMGVVLGLILGGGAMRLRLIDALRGAATRLPANP